MIFGQDSSSDLYFHQEIPNIWLSDGSSIDGYGLVYQFSGELNILIFYHSFSICSSKIINYFVTLRYSSYGKSMIVPQNNLILSPIIQRRKRKQIIGGNSGYKPSNPRRTLGL